MSTKIYNAFVSRGGVAFSVAKLFSLSDDIRNVMRAESRLMFRRKAAARIASLVDRIIVSDPMNGSTGEQGPFFLMLDDFHAAAESVKSGRRSPAWDFTFEWSFHLANGRLLLRIFAEDAMVDIFRRRFPAFTDYHYQDSTDKPNNVTQRAWAQRRRDWHEALGTGLETSAERGLSQSIWARGMSECVDMDINAILRHQPGFEKRVFKLARDRLQKTFLDPDLTPGASPSIGDVVEWMARWREYQGSPEAQLALASEAQLLRRRLPSRITRALAFASWGDIRSVAIQP